MPGQMGNQQTSKFGMGAMPGQMGNQQTSQFGMGAMPEQMGNQQGQQTGAMPGQMGSQQFGSQLAPAMPPGMQGSPYQNMQGNFGSVAPAASFRPQGPYGGPASAGIPGVAPAVRGKQGMGSIDGLGVQGLGSQQFGGIY